jgi:hypothetical protein
MVRFCSSQVTTRTTSVVGSFRAWSLDDVGGQVEQQCSVFLVSGNALLEAYGVIRAMIREARQFCRGIV